MNWLRAYDGMLNRTRRRCLRQLRAQLASSKNFPPELEKLLAEPRVVFEAAIQSHPHPVFASTPTGHDVPHSLEHAGVCYAGQKYWDNS